MAGVRSAPLKTPARPTAPAGRTAASAPKSSGPSFPRASAPKTSTTSHPKDSRPSVSSHHKESNPEASRRKPKPSEAGRDHRDPGEQRPRRNSGNHDPDRIPPRQKKSSAPTGNYEYLPQEAYQKLPSHPERRHRGDRPLSPGSLPPVGRSGGGSGGRGGSRSQSSPSSDVISPRKGWKENFPNGCQVQEAFRTAETVSSTLPQIVRTAQDLKAMLGSKNQGGRPPSPDPDPEVYAPSPSEHVPTSPRPGPGRERMRRYDADYARKPRDDENVPNDDADASTPGAEPRRFNERPRDKINRPSVPPNGHGGNSRRDFDYVPSPSNYSPSRDDYNVNPNVRGRKPFEQCLSADKTTPSAPSRGRGPNTETTSNRDGSSPLGPGGNKQKQDDSLSPNSKVPFRECVHTMEYSKGPLGAGPYDYRQAPPQPKKPGCIAFAGLCRGCDMKSRRDLEDAYLKAYETSYVKEKESIKARNNYKSEPTVDEKKAIKERLEISRNRSIKQVWDGWNQRWKSHIVDKFADDTGKAILKESGF